MPYPWEKEKHALSLEVLCERGHFAKQNRNGICTACSAEDKISGDKIRAERWRKNNPEKQRMQIVEQYSKWRARALIGAAKSRAKKKSLPFDLDQHVAYYHQLINTGVCQLTGLPFSKEHGSAFAPSLDRIKPKLGYVHGNMRVILFALNMGLGKWGEETYAQVAASYVQKISKLEETVAALRRDFAFAVKYSSVLVRSSNPDLRMVVNTERGQKLPPGEGTFTDGTTIELQDIGMPQIGVPTVTVQELVKTVMDRATELGLELT